MTARIFRVLRVETHCQLAHVPQCEQRHAIRMAAVRAEPLCQYFRVQATLFRLLTNVIRRLLVGDDKFRLYRD